jgi:hypothetical protein
MLITYHGIWVAVIDYCTNAFNDDILMRIATNDDNRWSNGWVSVKNLQFSEGATPEMAMKRVDDMKK